MGKKVGIMTLYHKTYNYGAQLQAYALQKVVQRLGYACELIKYQWCGIQTVMRYEEAHKNAGRFREFSREIPHSARLYTPATIHECAGEYDVFICGSDQIWGVEHSMPLLALPHISLSFVPDTKVKIAYAASMGGAVLAQRVRDAVAPWAARLDAVSVREKAAAPFVSGMTNKPVVWALDPTMLVSAADWRQIAIRPQGTGKYILVYNIGKNALLEAAAETLAARLGCAVHRLYYAYDDLAGPREFLGLVDGAEFVLTNSFHGTVFSLIFQKQFLAFGVDTSSAAFSKNLRLLDLLGALGLEDRFVGDTAPDSERLLAAPIGFDTIAPALRARQEASFEFLAESLKMEKRAEVMEAAEKAAACCGCGACAQKCPNTCITIREDVLGFLYPHRDVDRCSRCGLCDTACPIGKPPAKRAVAPRYYAAHHVDDAVRGASSSGGIFPALAGSVTRQGGVVFGAQWAEGFAGVEHSYAETMEECGKYRLSKYVQSDMRTVFTQAEAFLRSGRAVLFTGCPCQVAALRVYLNHDYPNLYAIGLICGGVTAPGLWRKNIRHYARQGELSAVNMRDKNQGFRQTYTGKASQMAMMLNGVWQTALGPDDLFLGPRFSFYRDCCYQCAYKGPNDLSDITIGDFCAYTQITGQMDSAKGESLVIVRSEKGKQLFGDICPALEWFEVPEAKTRAGNIMVDKNMPRPAQQGYLRAIFPGSSIEKLFYESKLAEQHLQCEMALEIQYYDKKRITLAAKLHRFLSLGLSMNEMPGMRENIIIYGSAQAGQLLFDCFESGVLCFVDRADEAETRRGLPVYRLASAELRKIMAERADVSFVVTPVRGGDDICDEISRLYENAHVVTAESLVEALWI